MWYVLSVIIAEVLLLFFFAEKTISISTLALAFLWPLTIILIVSLLIYEKYKEHVNKKIRSILNGKNMDECFDNLTLKEMEYIAFGERIKAAYLTDKVKNELYKRIEDSSFEDFFLKDGKK